MGKNSYLFTSESVTEGHPDKMADQISDAVLDSAIEQDPFSRVACETLLTTGVCIVSGEITTRANMDIPSIVRKTIREIGYTRAKYGFDSETCAIMTSLNKQSPDIAMGVDTGGAGDQGLMFGFACDETVELMPLPITLAHKLGMRLSEVRKSGVMPYLRPDGKTQVTVEYCEGKPVRVHTVVVSSQHSASVSMENIRGDIIRHVINTVISDELRGGKDIICHINPTGRFVVGGPMGDCGLTGRKIIVDTYGGMGRHGGGAFSGKDATKVDRSATYAARWVAKNIIAAGIAKRCEIQLAYAIGVAEPVSIFIDTFNTGVIPSGEIEKIVKKLFDLTPKGIIDELGLRKPLYKKTAAYGHFGRDGFPWESANKASAIRELAGKLGA
ncbi:MAG: methionine adenosyltransferase [Deferribacteraceae bacterium]|jgi:S-adenosylmethionine synthetase|nr:methionine adenosyltransferase [Deferribacteraceae bacterium]